MKASDLLNLIKADWVRVYRIFTLILITGTLLWTTANLIDKLGSSSPGKGIHPPTRQSPVAGNPLQPPPAQPLSAYLSITEKNPFGIAPSADGNKAGENKKPEGPPPLPPLELLGTISFGGQGGFAIFKETGQATKKVYKIGDSVNGRILMQVNRNMAVLKKENNELETVHARTRPLQSLALPEGEENSSEKFTARNELMKSLSDMIDTSVIRPQFNNGKMEGFVIGKVDPGSPLKARGFESGDLLQGINNKLIKGPDDVFMLQSLKSNSSEKVSFNIRRQGQPMVLNAP